MPTHEHHRTQCHGQYNHPVSWDFWRKSVISHCRNNFAVPPSIWLFVFSFVCPSVFCWLLVWPSTCLSLKKNIGSFFYLYVPPSFIWLSEIFRRTDLWWWHIYRKSMEDSTTPTRRRLLFYINTIPLQDCNFLHVCIKCKALVLVMFSFRDDWIFWRFLENILK